MLPVVASVVIDGDTTLLDVSVVGVVIVVSPVVLSVLDFAETVMCGDEVVVIDEYSTLPEESVVGSEFIVWWVVCSVIVGASQSTLKTCEWLLLLSEMM